MSVMFRSVSHYIKREDVEELELMIWVWVDYLNMIRLTF